MTKVDVLYLWFVQMHVSSFNLFEKTRCDYLKKRFWGLDLMENSTKKENSQRNLLFTVLWCNNASLVDVFFHNLGYLSFPGINQNSIYIFSSEKWSSKYSLLHKSIILCTTNSLKMMMMEWWRNWNFSYLKFVWICINVAHLITWISRKAEAEFHLNQMYTVVSYEQ